MCNLSCAQLLHFNAGMRVEAQTPDGQKVAFLVPAGVVGGQQLRLKYTPLVPAPAAAPAAPMPAAADAAFKAPTGAAETTKKLTESQRRSQAEDAKWTLHDVAASPLCFGRPDFRPFKDGMAPAGLIADSTFEKGGPRPGHSFVPDTHPALFVAAQGFDKKMFCQLEDATTEYAAAHGAGKKTYWAEYKPFDAEEIVAGCGLLLRAGVAPTPQLESIP